MVDAWPRPLANLQLCWAVDWASPGSLRGSLCLWCCPQAIILPTLLARSARREAERIQRELEEREQVG